MITSASNSEWPMDVEIEDLDTAGLPSESIVRMKLFTLDGRLILKHIGSLNRNDRLSVINSLQEVLPFIGKNTH